MNAKELINYMCGWEGVRDYDRSYHITTETWRRLRLDRHYKLMGHKRQILANDNNKHNSQSISLFHYKWDENHTTAKNISMLSSRVRGRPHHFYITEGRLKVVWVTYKSSHATRPYCIVICSNWPRYSR